MVLKSLAVALLLGLFLVSPQHVFAAAYGEGSYGEGAYNVGETSTTSDSTSTTESYSSPGAPVCTAEKPPTMPDLFQINARHTGVTLFITPVTQTRDRYFVSYATTEDAEEHGFEFVNDSDGAISVDVELLQPKTTYYFKVRAGNGCQPGDWSNILEVTSGQRIPSFRWRSLPRIVSTALTRQVTPSSISESQVPEMPTPPPSMSEAGQVEQDVTDSDRAAQESTAEPESPSLLRRIVNFFRRLLGR